jgi:heme exporter protein C
MTDSNPDHSSTAAPTNRLWVSGIALALLTALWAYLVISAPIDSTQGIIQKILYVHVPCWFAAYAGFGLTAIGGALYLWKNDERFDRAAVAGAEVGVLFCTLGLISGPIWAKGTWGHWWAWDPRLTVTLMLWFIYLAYLLLRSFTEGSARTARFAAVYGIAGMFAIPLNYFAIELFGGAAMHPDNLERGSLGAGMGWPFAVGVITALVALVHLVLLRFDLETRRIDAWQLEAALDQREA